MASDAPILSEQQELQRRANQVTDEVRNGHFSRTSQAALRSCLEKPLISFINVFLMMKGAQLIMWLLSSPFDKNIYLLSKT